jgi:hypothetical protein
MKCNPQKEKTCGIAVRRNKRSYKIFYIRNDIKTYFKKYYDKR